MAVFLSSSEEQTIQIGKDFGKSLHSGALVLFTGGLGSGKTTFCKGLALGLDILDNVNSPTFAIINEYKGRLVFAHFDLYRINSLEDLHTAGFFDYIDEGAVVCAEWSENAKKYLQGYSVITIDIQITNDEQRRITINREGRL